MKHGAFYNTIHFLYRCGCKVLIEKEGKFKLQPFSDDEVIVREVDVEKFREIKLLENLDQQEFDKTSILQFARTLGYIVVGRGV